MRKLKTFAAIAIFALFFAKIFAQDDNLHYTLAREYFAKGNYDLAMDSYKKVLSSFPDHYNSYMGLGDIYRIQGNLREAELSYSNALKYNPSWTTVQIKLADLYESQGRQDDALKMYREGLPGANQTQKNDIDAKINTLLKRKKEKEEAEKQAAAPKPKTAATSTSTTAKSQPAPAPVVKPIVITPAAKEAMDSAVWYYQRGTRTSNNSDLNKSLDFINTALKEVPTYPLAYYYAGLIRRRFGENDKAKVNFEKAIDDPELGYNAHFYLGKIYGDMKMYQQAIDNLEKYMEKTDYAQGKLEAQNFINNYKQLIAFDLAENPPIDVKAVTKADIADALTGLPTRVEVREVEARISSGLNMAVAEAGSSEGIALFDGVNLFNNKEYDKAIESFRKFIEKYPDRASAGSAVYNIGVCLFELQNWERANREFANYMTRYPKGAMVEDALFLSAVGLREQMKNNESQRMLNDYIKRFRNGKFVGKAYEYLGDVLADLDQQNSAIDAYKQADALAAKDEDKLHARYKQAEIYRKLKNVPAFEKAYLSVISLGEEAKISTRVPDSYYRLADHYYQEKRWGEATSYYNKAALSYPNYQDTPWGLYQSANCLYHTGKYREAIAAYDVLREKYPSNYWANEAEFRRGDAVWRSQYREKN
ncbi:MAG: tetratricopeptide repeat protein [Chitinivibrionia bacterium]|nr:tetratricopeptide repeat protein [Chitinivibrionia bacterium]